MSVGDVAGTSGQEKPLWQAHAHIPDDLAGQIRAWRAANSIPDHDLRPTGPPAQTAAGTRWQHHLDRQPEDTGLPDISEWWDQIAPLARHIAGDPQIRALAHHLNRMAIDGVDVKATLIDAIGDGPLPAEQTLGALAFRLERHRANHTEHIPRGWPPIIDALPRTRPEDHRPSTSPDRDRDRGISI